MPEAQCFSSGSTGTVCSCQCRADLISVSLCKMLLCWKSSHTTWSTDICAWIYFLKYFLAFMLKEIPHNIFLMTDNNQKTLFSLDLTADGWEKQWCCTPSLSISCVLFASLKRYSLKNILGLSRLTLLIDILKCIFISLKKPEVHSYFCHFSWYDVSFIRASQCTRHIPTAKRTTHKDTSLLYVHIYIHTCYIPKKKKKKFKYNFE